MTLERMQAVHKDAVDQMTKLRDKKEKALDILIRATARYQTAVKAVARSQKRLDKARAEERKARVARRKITAESKKEMPDIAATLGV